MQLTITSPVEKPEPYYDSYSVRIEVMHGDGDHYESFTIAGFRRIVTKDELLLESLLSVLQKMSKAFPHGRGGGPGYAFHNVVPEFESWFSSEDVAADYDEAWYKPEIDEERASLIDLAKRVNEHYARTEYVVWPLDVTYLDSEADISSFEVRYYDTTGREYHVDYEL